MEMSTSESSSDNDESEISDCDISSISLNEIQGSTAEKLSPWKVFQHKGPVFTPPYEPLPDNIKLKYNGTAISLSQPAEEIAGYYAEMMDKPCTLEPTFKKNFFDGWREEMTVSEKELIQDFSKCDFKEIQQYFIETKNKRKERKKEQKKNDDKIYKYCIIDGKKEQIKNYKVEAPGLYKAKSKKKLQGSIKKRILPEQVTINCSNDDQIPKPPPGHEWKAIKHIDTDYWLASYASTVTGKLKYIKLDNSSYQQQLLDKKKYDIARELHKHIEKIRKDYRADWEHDNYEHRQRGVALYFIDTLGFRAGNEQEKIPQDTAGCCNLKVKHIDLSNINVVKFDFCGKSNVKYENTVLMEERVYQNLRSFIANKNPDADLFDKISTQKLNNYLGSQMTNLTAKVFRTYNASIKFERRLEQLTKLDIGKNSNTVETMIKAFNEANMEIAILLNHKKKKGKPMVNPNDSSNNTTDDMIQEYNPKTSLSEYIDPRIVVTWCERYNIPLNKVYTKKFMQRSEWAIKEAGPNFIFA